jgi:hypothetical protein
MKKLLLLVFILCLIGCINNKQKKLIESFVCTKDGVISDLNFKMIKLGETTPITATDSAVFWCVGEMPLNYVWIGDTVKGTYLNEGDTLKEYFVPKSNIDTLLKFFYDDRDFNLKQIQKDKGWIQEYETGKTPEDPYHPKELTIQSLKNDIKYWEENNANLVDPYIKKYKQVKHYFQLPPETPLSRSFECTYSLLNPELQVRQTMTRTFYFDNELTKVFGSSDIKK